MTDHRFDRFVRDLHATRSRRQVFRFLAGAIASVPAWGSGQLTSRAAPRATNGCGPGLFDCGGVCVDLESDPNHCGSCGHACAPGQACCGSTYISPFGLCVDLMSDPSNCGGCGVICAANHACVNGGCLFFGCAAPLSPCSGNCVDLQNDAFNCGFCGNVCPGGICQGGVCATPFICGPGLTDCGGFCTDLANDWQNCGACGNACASAVCQGGVCVNLPSCGPGLSDCGGICVDLLSDPAHCGFCGTVCPAGGWCQNGQCFACIGNAVNCGGVCVDLMSDAANCGACGNICLAGICQAGACVVPAGCPPGYTDCFGTCVDLANDGANCGACGTVCPSGACVGGLCATPATPCFPPKAICHGVCIDLSSDPANCGACDFGCGAGPCQNGVCTLEMPPCPPGLSHCGWFCVDPQTDPFNCGSCEFVCLPGEVCEAGVCVTPAGQTAPCPPPLTMCAGTCVDLSIHTFHCGACFNACAGVPPPGQSSVGQCIAGVCHVVCEPGFTNCGETCVDLASNRQHCGACRAACPSGQTCAGGQCVSVAPPATVTPVPTTKAPAPPADPWHLWSAGVTQLRGAHIYQRRVDPAFDEPDAMGSGPFGPAYTQDDFDALAALGANYVEISHPGLDTEAPPYDLDEAVQENLDRLLAMAARANLFAVIGFRTGPGRNELSLFRPGPRRSPAPRLTGPNPEIALGDVNDRVWLDGRTQDAWGKMWYETAQRYRDNPIVIGYNLMVEPNANAVVPGSDDPADFYPAFADTPADWNRLTPWLTRAVRDGDPDTPILISPLSYGGIAWLPYLQPTKDQRTVYRVNQYEPRRYVLSESGPDDPARLTFPGTFDPARDGISGPFDRAWLNRLLQPLDDFAAEHGVPLAVATFGALRWQAGIAGFVGTQMELFERRGLNHGLWLWAPAGESWTEIDELSIRHGPDPDQHTPADSELLAVVRADWQRNTVRPAPA